VNERRDDSKLWEKLNNIHNDVIEVKGDVKSVTEKVDGHETILLGENKRNGLVGDVNVIKNTGSTFKWIAGVGGLSGMGGFLSKFFGNGH
jgi:hypothetical protein